MDRQEATRFVVRQLANYRLRHDVLFELTQRYDLNLEEAQEFLQIQIIELKNSTGG